MIEEYLKARKAGDREYKARIAKGEYPFLPALDDVLADAGSMPQQPVGLMEIPVDLIVGTRTRARQNSFAPNFMPLLAPDTEFAMKWSNLYRTQVGDGYSSPIKVFEYLHKFYVQEGNKRVSVSRFLEAPAILAEVIRILPTEQVMRENPAYAEFLDFYRVAPIYDIVCTVPGSYREIAQLVGREIGPGAEPWPEDLVKTLKTAYWNFSEAVASFRDEIPDLAPGDAFLVYLRIYLNDALRFETDKEMQKRLTKIRKELLTAHKASRNEEISLIESSEDALKAGDLVTKTGSLLSRPGSIIGKVLPVRQYSDKHPLKAAFIYDGLPEDSSWVYDHEAGRRRVQAAYGGIVETAGFAIAGAGRKTKAPCRIQPDFTAAVTAAVEWGAEVIFTTAARHMNDTLRAAIRYEDVIFLNCSVNLAHQAVRTYYAKQYESKFLAGIVAASRADNHMIGYCSDYPIYGTVAGINAFAIGAAMVDPEVRIYLDWTTRQNVNWWHDMLEQGIRVISAVDSMHNIDGSDAYGVFHVEACEPGTGNDLSRNYQITNLAVPIWKWGKLYEIILRTILEGTYHAKLVDRKDQATNYWWGMISGVVDIELTDNISPYTKQLVEVLRRTIIAGDFNPFDGALRSQTGWVRRADEPPLTSKDIITMNWLNENVIGEIPAKDALTDEARETVSIAGVKG
ncbi:MAG: BMP family ABC transporter substrate-binding protein [Mogibacterium sp.]|nr:BMP family ABC transporter substrate-binding protein [Mogibacterium sp.]